MELLQLSSNHIEFTYNKYDNMQSTMVIYNNTLTPIAYKFKASNRNIFLVRPSIGIVQPKQNQFIRVTLHCKVFENTSINEFNEKLQLISFPIFSGIQDPTPIFKDSTRQFENQKIKIVISSFDKQIMSQIGGSPNFVFESLHKQNSQFDQYNPLIEPKYDQNRFKVQQYQAKNQVMQQEIAQKEQQLLNFQKTHSVSNEKFNNDPNKNSKDTLLLIIVSIMSFYIILRYFDIINKVNPR
ncbi:unnamed protein product [Paramecium sonneborni]|uniref:MSP domain-containing protein n=1 Tax=Paramecium sonneborni TaxID=65129 RepID=A0A8S1R2E0_9CILI|nr:unnamed protein product [Paramecium sonneborni]